MDKLKSFIQDNKTLFETESLSQEHEKRFMERLAKSQSIKKFRTYKYLIYISSAALLIVVLAIGLRFLKEDPLAVFPSDPCRDGSHICYYNQIRKLSSRIEYDSRNLPEYKRQEIIMNIQSLVPSSAHEFSDKLPADISDKEADRLNIEYYKQLYEGMKEIASLTNQT